MKKEVTKKPKIHNKELSQALPFHPKKTKKLKKRQILRNILPFFEDIAITRRERAFRGSAETYNIEVVDNISLADSLYLAKRSIIDFLKDNYQKKEALSTAYLSQLNLKNGKLR